MERWLQNVVELRLKYPADLLLVDNSPGLEYVEKMKGYCAKYGIKNYKIEHIELPQEKVYHEKIARSREIIRQEMLAHDYDAWFTWESDQLIPTNTLGELVRIMKGGNFMMINPNNWARGVPDQPNTDHGLSLIKREVLEKHGFLLEFGTDPEMPKNWDESDAWFKKRVLRDGGNFIELYGVIEPVYHLNE